MAIIQSYSAILLMDNLPVLLFADFCSFILGLRIFFRLFGRIIPTPIFSIRGRASLKKDKKSSPPRAMLFLFNTASSFG